MQPQVLTVDDIAAQFVDKLKPQRRDTRGFSPADYVTQMLSDRSGDAPLLAVFDNFETVRNPADVYAWLSNASGSLTRPSSLPGSMSSRPTTRSKSAG